MRSKEEKPFCAWSRTVEECLEEYNVSLEKGLSFQEVEKRRQRYGWNELHKENGKPLWKLILDQFDDRLVHILLGAALISFILAYLDKNEIGEEGMTAYVEPFVILLVLMLNAAVRVWKETNAEKALEALKEMKSEQAKVLRDGSSIPHLPARELVSGDIVELGVGDKVSADMRIASLKTSILRMEQSSLTGESHPVVKSTKTVFMDDCELQAKECMVFAGTTVVNGCCTCIVVSIGMSTEIGQIQVQIQEAALEDDDTPLKKKLHEFGENLAKGIGFVCLLAWIISYKSFLSWDVVDGWPKNIRFSFGKCTYYIKIAVALTVAAIPVGLPAVITVCLALGTWKMARMNAIVRKLPSVETLGCTTVICSDKTGTLTTNQMSVTQFVTLGHTVSSIQEFHVEGTTYNPTDGSILNWPAYMSENLETLAEIAAICNDAGISCQGHEFHATGMPTEAALKVFVEKMGISSLKARNHGNGGNVIANHTTENGTVKLVYCNQLIEKSKRLASLEFDRIRKSMGVIVKDLSGQNRLLVKGAMENVLERSAFLQLADGTIVEMDDASRELLLMKLHQMSSKALRCLGLAYKEDLGEFNDYDGENHPAHMKLLDPAIYSEIENNLIFVGLTGLRDSPREEVHEAIKDCREAGIQVMVITGDNKFTAEAVCRDIGIFYEGENLNGKSFTGKEFMELPLNKRREVLEKPGGCVFSRAEPRHKQDIVLMLKEAGQVIAMTGDGVNDAPALKLADIGIAMGITGTEVAKEASDMVLVDNNFSTIVAAVSEGRSIYNTMKAFIGHMILSNIGEITSIFITAALGMPDGLIPVQLLWLNLVIDGPPTMALGFNHSDIDIMRKPPRKSNDSLINAWEFFRYMVIGLYVGLATVGIFALWFTHDSFLGIDFSADGHTLVTFSQLTSWGECPSWEGFTVSPFSAGGRIFSFDSNPCDYFSNGKAKATTLSLSVLVAIELFNSLNALSEDYSLLTMPPWINPWLMLAMSVSFGLHALILYVPFLANIFGIVPLSFSEWCLVIVVSFPVILIDEVLKLIRRRMSRGHEKYKTV